MGLRSLKRLIKSTNLRFGHNKSNVFGRSGGSAGSGSASDTVTKVHYINDR